MIKIACCSAVAFALFFGTVCLAETASPQPAEYPLKTCVVTGEKLDGAMGAPYKLEHKGRTLMLCCKPCVKKFNKDPEKYLKKLDEALAKAKK